jgi:hypothetical protein
MRCAVDKKAWLDYFNIRQPVLPAYKTHVLEPITEDRFNPQFQ